jgi:hypothetical protein
MLSSGTSTTARNLVRTQSSIPMAGAALDKGIFTSTGETIPTENSNGMKAASAYQKAEPPKARDVLA